MLRRKGASYQDGPAQVRARSFESVGWYLVRDLFWYSLVLFVRAAWQCSKASVVAWDSFMTVRGARLPAPIEVRIRILHNDSEMKATSLFLTISCMILQMLAGG
jgi:hypothetical protein